MRGHITSRTKGSWSIVLDLGRDPANGKRRQQWVTIKGTKRDAERKLAELQHQLDTGTFVKPSKLALGDFLHQWLGDYVETNVRPRTGEGYKTIVNAHLVPRLGHIFLTELKASQVQAYYKKALQGGRLDGKPGGLSARTVLHHHRVLSEALRYAVKWGLVLRNVAEAVDPPRPNKVEYQTLDEPGVEALLEAAKDTIYYPLIHLAVFTGLRRSELLGLRWKDIDLARSNLSVVQVLHRLRDGRIIYQEPKTNASRRSVSLSPEVVRVLLARKKQQAADQNMMGGTLADDDLTFANPGGSPMLPDSVSHAFTKIARRAGSNIRLHDLRHTHASLMMKQGTSPKVVQERLGHSNFAVTMDIYSHVAPGMQEEAALRFEEGLTRTATNKFG